MSFTGSSRAGAEVTFLWEYDEVASSLLSRYFPFLPHLADEGVKQLQCLTLNILFVFYVLLRIKYWFVKLSKLSDFSFRLQINEQICSA